MEMVGDAEGDGGVGGGGGGRGRECRRSGRRRRVVGRRAGGGEQWNREEERSHVESATLAPLRELHLGGHRRPFRDIDLDRSVLDDLAGTALAVCGDGVAPGRKVSEGK